MHRSPIVGRAESYRCRKLPKSRESWHHFVLFKGVLDQHEIISCVTRKGDYMSTRAPKWLNSFDVRARVGSAVGHAVVLQKITPFWKQKKWQAPRPTRTLASRPGERSRPTRTRMRPEPALKSWPISARERRRRP